MNTELIDAVELSKRLNIKKGTLYDWVRRGKIPFVRLESLVRFDVQDIDQWLQEKKKAVCVCRGDGL
jgi:excisionase family DNA binding protein